MRDSLFMDEIQLAIKTLKGGAPWVAVRSMFPGVDPIALDTNFKEMLHTKADIPVPKPSSLEVAAQKSAKAAAAEAASKPANPLE